MMFVVVSVVACVALLILLDHRQTMSSSRQQGASVVTEFTRQTEFLLQANRQSLHQVQALIQDKSLAPGDDLAVQLQLISHPILHQQQLLLAPDLEVQAVFPDNVPSVLLNHSLRNDPRIWPKLQVAIEQHQSIFVSLLNQQPASQNEPLWLLLSPVFSDDQQLWGVIGAQLDYRQLLIDAGLTAVLRDYAVYLQSGGQVQQLRFDPELGESLVFDAQFDTNSKLTDSHLQSFALPIDGWRLLLKERDIPVLATQHPLLYGCLLILIPLLAALAYWLAGRSVADNSADVAHLELHREYDNLTKLPNRKSLISQLNTFIAQYQSNRHQTFALFYIDLDHFKEVNVLFGYPAGDAFLLQLSVRMRNFLPADGLLARCGSDEFVMMVNGVDHQQAEIVANNLLECLAEPLQMHGHTLACSSSIGIALYPQHSQDAATLVSYADRAMFTAKKTGRATYCLVDQAVQNYSTEDLSLRKELEQALCGDAFALSYQPIVDMQSGLVLKCEALLCWRDKKINDHIGEHGIQIAEQGGLIREIGLWVLERACMDLQVMRAHGHDMQVAVNRSSQEFLMPDASTRWLALLEKYHIAQHHIVFEITESLLMHEQDKTTREIEILKTAGIDFSVDDFGTGYSAINYLRRFPVSFLKIDRSFVARMFESAQDRVLVEIMVKLGSALNIQVIAEGVETQQQYQALLDMGCHYAQGYFVAKPMRLNQWIEFLNNNQLDFAIPPAVAHSRHMGLQ
jgi:diguanylate cyclase (GGDEF)-like protein